jgi:hypothetical protein
MVSGLMFSQKNILFSNVSFAVCYDKWFYQSMETAVMGEANSHDNYYKINSVC